MPGLPKTPKMDKKIMNQIRFRRKLSEFNLGPGPNGDYHFSFLLGFFEREPPDGYTPNLVLVSQFKLLVICVCGVPESIQYI